MGIFDKLKKRVDIQEEVAVKKGDNVTHDNEEDIHANLGVVQPFTILVSGQFNSFIGELAKDSLGVLTETEKKAFDVLWDVACIDMGGCGNNIWNLKHGTFEVYNEDEVIVKFEKKSSKVEDKYGSEKGRADFVYLSPEGNFIINQSDRNSRAFLVYVSENTSERLLTALRKAEAEALEIVMDNSLINTSVGIPNSVSSGQLEDGSRKK